MEVSNLSDCDMGLTINLMNTENNSRDLKLVSASDWVMAAISGERGEIQLYKPPIFVDNKYAVFLSSNAEGILSLGFRENSAGNMQSRVSLRGDTGSLHLGGNGVGGHLSIFSKTTEIAEDVKQSSILLNGNPGGGDSIAVRQLGKDNKNIPFNRNIFACSYNNKFARLFVGAHKSEGGAKSGFIAMRDNNGEDSIILNGNPGGGDSIAVRESGTIKDENNRIQHFTRNILACSYNDTSAGFRIGAHGGGKPGYVRIRDYDGNDSVIIEGDKGDITLQNADCAEEFDMSSSELSEIESGTVMVLDDDGRLEKSSKAYDRRVAGVVSGAGGYKPGIILDKKISENPRIAIAMVGKVYCKVNADESSIAVGDILTTSNIAGHAMKATNRYKAFGAVIGKALQSLKKGKDLIPILIALQ
jgi:hypothetical protein